MTTLSAPKTLTFRPESPCTKLANVVWVTRRNVWHSKHKWPVMLQPRYGDSFTDPVLLHTASLFSFRKTRH